MAEKGILFNGEMMRADAKTQTRRPMKPQPATGEVWLEHIANDRWLDAEHGGSELWPPYAVGDLLYCRETWVDSIIQGCILYRADRELTHSDRALHGVRKWRPSIHMPKWAAREWLKVTAVRAERVQEISRKDVWAEGINQDEYETWLDDVQNIGVPAGTTYEQPKDLFQREWDAIYYRKEGLKWDDNPWAWVTEFERKDDGQTEDSSGAGAPGR